MNKPRDPKSNQKVSGTEAPSIQKLREKMQRKLASSKPQSTLKSSSENPAPKSVPPPKTPEQKHTVNQKKKPAVSKAKIPAEDIRAFSQSFYHPLPLLKKMNSRRCLALDIDVDKIRYILALKSGDFIQVKEWGVQKFPREISHRFRALQITLENIKQKLYKGGTEVRISVFSTDFMIEQDVFPYMKKKEDLKKALFFKFREEIKRFKEDEFLWNYEILEQFEEEGIKKVRVQVVFSPKETINRYMYIFEHLKINVQQLIPRPAGLWAAYERLVENPKSDLLINISYDFTQIIYLKQGNLSYIRNLGVGARNLEFTIHDNSGTLPLETMVTSVNSPVPENKQESILRKRLLEKIKDLKTKQNPVLHTFFSEFLRSIAYIQGMDRNNYVDRVLLTGYGIYKESLLPYLKNRLNIPIFVIYPKLDERPLREQLKFGEFFTTFGTLVQKHEGFNLLPEQFKERIRFKKLGRWLFFIMFLTGLIAGYLSFVQYQIYQQQAAVVMQKEKEYLALNPYEQAYKNLLVLIGNAKKENENLKSIVEKRAPVIEMMRLLSNLTPKQIRLNAFVFRKIQSESKMVNQEEAKKLPKYGVTIEGEIVGDFVNGDVILINFINSLNNLKFFKKIHLDHKERDPQNNKINFGLTMEF